MDSMLFSGLGSMSRAARKSSGVMTEGRPPVRPRARAAARPSFGLLSGVSQSVPFKAVRAADDGEAAALVPVPWPVRRIRGQEPGIAVLVGGQAQGGGQDGIGVAAPEVGLRGDQVLDLGGASCRVQIEVGP